MSDIRFNRWLHQSGTGGVSQDSSGNIGIGTTVPTMALDVRGDINVGDTININNASGIISATTITATTGTFSGNMSVTGNVSIAGTLTYEDVSNIDAVGIITAQSDIVVGGGLTVTGISTFNNDVKLLDNDKLKFGIGEDLQIYHNGSNSIIEESGTGNLSLRTNSGIKFDTNGNETLAEFTKNGSVDLYYDASKKFETTNTGAVVTGILTATSSVTGSNYEIAAISSTISDTAVDVFVYDTRKDSDGGAWRKKTQNTSWYNETLGTATRGSRKEFPAVAVIVAETTQVTIYDGDDPDLPMWMVFNQTGSSNGQNSMINRFMGNLKSVSMLNGNLTIIGNSTSSADRGGGVWINFISEFGYAFGTNDSQGENIFGTLLHNIAQRNTILGASVYADKVQRYQLVDNSQCNDVAMTVLPNAPIDSATGLQIPTIAVATNSGVSVIRDDGTVYDVIDSNGSRKCYDVSFTKDHKIMHTGDLGAGGTYAGNVFVTNVLTADRAEYDNHSDLYRWYSTSAMYPRINGGNTFNTRVLDPLDVGGHHYAMADVGISLIEDGTSSSYGNTDGMVAYITSDYNTGYMHGDIKGAFLSDTDTTNVTGSELITNGDFSGGTTGWTAESGGTSIAVSSGVLNVTRSNSPTAGRMSTYQQVTGLTVGEIYVLTGYVTAVSNAASIGVSIDTAGTGYDPDDNDEGHYLSHNWVIANGHDSNTVPVTITVTFKAAQTSYYIGLGARNSASATASFDNISLRKAEYDRSVNNKGLQVFGTVTKSAVATGADLVAYSGFSASNYLQQPYNTDLAPGTNPYGIACWFKTGTSTGDQYIFDRSGTGSGSRNLLLIMQSTASGGNANRFQWWHRDASGNVTDIKVADKRITDNQWHQVVALNNGARYELYVDGEVSSVTNSTIRNVASDGNPHMYVGIRHTLGSTFMTGSMALFRYFKTAPTPEQIKKMYNDEKHLFQENAKATLYGSSDAVTALGYDEDADLLHVGTSAGRSDFQGLRRINNTTTAVTTAISASDDFIAEQ